MASLDNQSCAQWKTPGSVAYLKSLETEYLVITVICGVVVLITNIILISEIIFIYRRRNTWPQPGKTMWLLSLYTIFAWTAFVGVLVPRAGDLGSMVATMYLAVSLFVFKRLMVSYYGGTNRMMERLEGSEYVLRSPPCCCCCCCLPNIKVTKSSYLMTEIFVLQFTIFQPLLVFLEAVIIADLQEKMDSRISLSSTTLGTISSMFALYGLFLFFRVSIQHLSYAGITAKFVCLKLLVGIDGLQKLILSSLASAELVPCASGLSHQDNAVRISRFMMIFEAFLISILARIYYKRDQNLHLHPDHGGHTMEDSSETSQLVKSGSTSSNEPSDPSSTLVGSVEPRYGATDGITNGDNGSWKGAKSSPIGAVQTEQPKAQG